MLVDCAILFCYISDLQIDDDEWELRMHILELHDVNSRGRIEKHLDETKRDATDKDENEKRQQRKAATSCLSPLSAQEQTCRQPQQGFNFPSSIPTCCL